MASSRRTGTNEQISTYGTGKTYTSLATWEADTDTDLVTATQSQVLEVYGTGYTDGNVTLAGATTNSSYFRIIRPESGNRLYSSPTTYHFDRSTTTNIFNLTEAYVSLEDINSRQSGSAGGNINVISAGGSNDGMTIVGCQVFDVNNTGAGGATAFNISITSGTIKIINCLAHNSKTTGFAGPAAGGTLACYNCTSTNNGTAGFSRAAGTHNAYGCGANGNGTDFSGTITQTNCSTSAPTFAAGTDNFHLDSADTAWKDADTNTGSWHASAGYDDDIDRGTRSGTWDIGFDEVTASGYTLTASSGSYTLTGTAATLKRDSKITAAAGSYTITGTAATLKKGYKLTADAGSYTVTGTAATLKRDAKLTADAGSYTITGTDAALSKTGSYTLAAASGSYTVTGTAATLKKDSKLTAAAGSYTLTGTAATLKRDSKITAAAGSYTLTGTAATLTKSTLKTIIADAGSYTVTGTAATLRKDSKLTAAAGLYILTGTAAGLGPMNEICKSPQRIFTKDDLRRTFKKDDGRVIFRHD